MTSGKSLNLSKKTYFFLYIEGNDVPSYQVLGIIKLDNLQKVISTVPGTKEELKKFPSNKYLPFLHSLGQKKLSL